jgi:MFS family permease
VEPKANTRVDSGATATTAQAPLPLEYAHPPAGLWTVGTLTYTTAGVATVFFWLLLGDLGPSFRDRGAGRSAELLLKKLEASNQALALLNTTIPQLITLVLLPVISFNSDRFRSRWGRRIPFLLLSVPLVSGAMIGVAFCPELGGQLDKLLGSSSPGLKSSKLIVYGILWAIFTIGGLCAASTRAGLTNDVVPRPFLGRFAGSSRAVSLICGIIFNLLVLGHVQAHFRLIYICLAIASGLTLTIMCLVVKEGDYPPPEPISGGATSRACPHPGCRHQIDARATFCPHCGREVQPLASTEVRSGGFFAGFARFLSSAKVYLRECFTNPYYRWVLAAFTLIGLTFLPVGAYSTFYAVSMNLDMTTYGRILATNHFCGFLLAFPIGMLADRFHPLRVSIIAMSLYAVTALLGALFIRSTWSFEVAVFGHMFVSGIFFSASGALAMMLLPRIKFAQFASAATLVSAIATIIITQALGALLDYTNSNYRLTYFIGFGMAVLAIIVMLIVYRKFMALGGPKGYVAPE